MELFVRKNRFYLCSVRLIVVFGKAIHFPDIVYRGSIVELAECLIDGIHDVSSKRRWFGGVARTARS